MWYSGSKIGGSGMVEEAKGVGGLVDGGIAVVVVLLTLATLVIVVAFEW